MPDGQELLERHNPVLVVFPQQHEGRRRPGAHRPGRLGWGDYHPCSVEFFLGLVALREQPRPWQFSKLIRPWLALVGVWTRERRTGTEALQEAVAGSAPDATREWELDVADIPSQSERGAWHRYGEILEQADQAFHPAVYGRYLQGPPAVLQYWYLYVYNDFWNNHEADWEMVTVELDDDQAPTRIGLSSHLGGTRRDWSGVGRVGDRPVVYVARGSHAGYFHYAPAGVKMRNLIPQIYLPSGLHWLTPLLSLARQARMRLLPIRDYLAADPELDPDAREQDKGERISPSLRVVPSEDEREAGSEWWWLDYWGKWGSSHSRIVGTVGPDSPWAADPNGHDKRWHDPAAWIASLEVDQG